MARTVFSYAMSLELVDKYKPSTIMPDFHVARASDSKKLHQHTCTFLLRSAIKVSFSVVESTTIDCHLKAGVYLMYTTRGTAMDQCIAHEVASCCTGNILHCRQVTNY